MTWTLHHGDSLLWLPTLAAESVDMLLTDPPYSSGGQFRGDRAAGSVSKYIRGESQENRQYPEFFGDNRDQRSMLAWCALWLAQCHRAMASGGVVALFVDWRQLPTVTDALQAGGFVWRGIIAWDKTEASRPLAAGYPRHQCEYVVWGSKGALPERAAGTGLTIPGCLRCAVPADKAHPTEKPLALLLDLLKIGKPGGTVLDPFAGSGAVGAAALRSGMRFLGAELSPEYAERARALLAAEEANLSPAAARSGQLPLLGAEP